MLSTCMLCGNEIAMVDLGAKICVAILEKEKNPFFLPILVSEPVHASSRLCGQCAKGRSTCPCCNGALAPREEIASAIILNVIGRKAFDAEFRGKRKIDGTFRSIFLVENALYFSYIADGMVYESFWKEV